MIKTKFQKVLEKHIERVTQAIRRYEILKQKEIDEMKATAKNNDKFQGNNASSI